MFALPCIIQPRLHFHNHPPTSSHIYPPLPVFPFQCLLDLGCEWGVILMTLLAHCFGCWLACTSSLFGPTTKTPTLCGLGDSACLWPAQEGRAFNGWMATRESERRGDGRGHHPRPRTIPCMRGHHPPAQAWERAGDYPRWSRWLEAAKIGSPQTLSKVDRYFGSPRIKLIPALTLLLWIKSFGITPDRFGSLKLLQTCLELWLIIIKVLCLPKFLSARRAKSGLPGSKKAPQ